METKEKHRHALWMDIKTMREKLKCKQALKGVKLRYIKILQGEIEHQKDKREVTAENICAFFFSNFIFFRNLIFVLLFTLFQFEPIPSHLLSIS